MKGNCLMKEGEEKRRGRLTAGCGHCGPNSVFREGGHDLSGPLG